MPSPSSRRTGTLNQFSVTTRRIESGEKGKPDRQRKLKITRDGRSGRRNSDP